jgi:hypothetical protein
MNDREIVVRFQVWDNRFVAFFKKSRPAFVIIQPCNQWVSGEFFLEFSGRFMKLAAHHHNSFDEENRRGCASTAPYGFMACAGKTLKIIVDITLQMPHLCQTWKLPNNFHGRCKNIRNWRLLRIKEHKMLGFWVYCRYTNFGGFRYSADTRTSLSTALWRMHDIHRGRH